MPMPADAKVNWSSIQHKSLRYFIPAMLEVFGYKFFIDPTFDFIKIKHVLLFWIFFIIPSAYLLTRIQNAIFVIFTLSKIVNEEEHATSKNSIANFILEGILSPALVVIVFYNYMLYMDDGVTAILSPFHVANLMDLFKVRCGILLAGAVCDLLPELLKKHTGNAKLPPFSFGLQLMMETVWYVYVLKRLYFPLSVK